MADYPTSLKITLGDSKRTRRDGRTEDTLGDGIARVRKMYADRFDFDIKHAAQTAAEVAVLEAFYNANLTASDINLYWPETATYHIVKFGASSYRTLPIGKGLVDVWVRLVAAA